MTPQIPPITVSVKTAGELLGLSPYQAKNLCDKGLLESGYTEQGKRLVLVKSIQAYAESLPADRPTVPVEEM
jgi:hypothetical protein